MSEETLMSLKDIDGLILRQPKHNQGEGGILEAGIEAGIGTSRWKYKPLIWRLPN